MPPSPSATSAPSCHSSARADTGVSSAGNSHTSYTLPEGASKANAAPLDRSATAIPPRGWTAASSATPKGRGPKAAAITSSAKAVKRRRMAYFASRYSAFT